ncbi:MAG: 50S ribosomal protein L35ae [Candidatus Micrarchaeota archaeon]|nr:50S ribosomal protein L35ae [Candidatus Micrarchaeota archaeon]
MEGTIHSYRRGLHDEHRHQYVITVSGVETRAKAQALCGKKLTWKSSTKKPVVGTVSHVHGNKGAILGRFSSGLPGQALGTKVAIA